MFNKKQTNNETIMASNQSANLDTLIGKNTHIKGDLKFSGTMYITSTASWKAASAVRTATTP